MDYEVNKDTLVILPVEHNKCRVIEEENEYFIETKAFDVIEHSCEYFGSSYTGRHNGTKKLTGHKYKSPIIIEESSRLIMFPTHSPRNSDCVWISLNKIKRYYKGRLPNTTTVEFITNDKLELNVSYAIINNQILRATRLQTLMEDRLKNIQNIKN